MVILQRTYASFPWYALPEMRAATDAFYAALRERSLARGVDRAPETLDRERPHGTDETGACFFTQTCGYPLFTTARNHFTVLGAPCYAAPGCEGPLHKSFIMVRDASAYREIADLHDARFAVNEADSNSGMNISRRLFADRARDGSFFASVRLSGSHVRSVELIAEKVVDAAAIDCVTYALLARYRPSAVRSLRAIAETASSPTPPFVTSVTTDDATTQALRAALHDVVSMARYATVCDALLLADVAPCDERAYAIVMAYEREAAARGYRTLR